MNIVIVNWNSRNLLSECLASIDSALSHSTLSTKVIVVDNASSDGSHLRYRGPLVVELIQNVNNEGFSRACNQGAACGVAPYVLFSNPDTRLESGALDVAYNVMERPASSDIAVCGIQLIGDDGKVTCTCTRLPTTVRLFNELSGLSRLLPMRFPGTLMTEWNHAESRAVEHVIGAFYFMRRSVFEALNGFDEDYLCMPMTLISAIEFALLEKWNSTALKPEVIIRAEELLSRFVV